MNDKVRGTLSTFSRPDQVGWWFRSGCRNFEKVPSIPSCLTYQKFWIAWWSSIQPAWRHAENWPLPRKLSVDGPWDNLLVRGKDGLFVVVMSLLWWIIEEAKGESEASELNEAIADVSWVLAKLVSVLSVRGTSPTSSHPASSHPTSSHLSSSARLSTPSRRSQCQS